MLSFFFLMLILYVWRGWRRKSWEPQKIKIKIPFTDNEIEIVPNHEVVKIAHQARIELLTRKAGLPFEEDNDVIVEVYDSWYKLFGEIRALTKAISAHHLTKSTDAQCLSDTLIHLLNSGLRPHLTRWQARFRRWYAAKLAKHPDKSPQEIQQLYPQYQALVDDLKTVNDELVKFAEELKVIAYGRR